MSMRACSPPPSTPLSSRIQQSTVASPGVSLSTGASANVTSIAVGAGTFLIWANVDFALAGLTATGFRVGMNTTSATLPTQPGGGGVGPDALTVLPMITTLLSAPLTYGVGPCLLTLAASATLYLVAQVNFTLGTVSAYGTLTVMEIDKT